MTSRRGEARKKEKIRERKKQNKIWQGKSG
jgi:hypothetical protein